MPRPKNSPRSKPIDRPALARTPENRENQVIAAAMDLAFQQILDGTASSQVITHFLKLGSSKNELEKEKLRHENELLRAKTDAIESAKELKDMYENAISAMRIYQGVRDNDEYDDY